MRLYYPLTDKDLNNILDNGFVKTKQNKVELLTDINSKQYPVYLELNVPKVSKEQIDNNNKYTIHGNLNFNRYNFLVVCQDKNYKNKIRGQRKLEKYFNDNIVDLETFKTSEAYHQHNRNDRKLGWLVMYAKGLLELNYDIESVKNSLEIFRHTEVFDKMELFNMIDVANYEGALTLENILSTLSNSRLLTKEQYNSLKDVIKKKERNSDKEIKETYLYKILNIIVKNYNDFEALKSLTKKNLRQATLAVYSNWGLLKGFSAIDKSIIEDVLQYDNNLLDVIFEVIDTL